MAEEGVSFSDQVRALARSLGFEAVGIARANEPLDTDYLRYRAFVNEGLHGEMAWLARDAALRERLDGDGILMGAKSVVCVARRYPNDARQGAGDGDALSGIARYARGRDYHRFLRRRLRRVATFLRSLGTPESPVHARPLCDEEPVLERAWAVRAGLGFVGKNGLLIVPGLGSMVLLGEVVTTLDLEPDRAPARVEERCGSCTRCLDACPTQAFRAPFVLDPRRCISYLTIEQRGAVPEPLREAVGTHLFGCDDCQTICPFNAGVGARSPLDRSDGDPFAPLERWSRVRLESLLALDAAEWHALFEGTPLRRIGRAGVARNAALVLGNRGDEGALPALRTAAAGHEDTVVRETAAWAVSRLERVDRGPAG
ncbi:MAG TPA: tRNA epoxyqueuosine(34) reductase QueG [Polyangiaceae bacterium]|jgi:epoxyqueuosine reductase